MTLQTNARPRDVDTSLLRAWPLPMPSNDADKEDRGHVLVLGGSREMPGAVILAATAALRAGAGKLTIATGRSVAQLVALAIPESRVLGLAENDAGGFTVEAVAALDPLADKISAILIGPGMQDEAATARLVHALLPRLDGTDTNVLLDAEAMGAVLHPPVGNPPFRFNVPVLLTPHAGEMAHLTGIAKEEIGVAPDRHAVEAAQEWNAVVALKGARTVIAAPGGERWQHEGGNVGLATSGSGDVLAGIIAGLAARGAGLAQAAAWGVALHARAGERLAERFGRLGYLARELCDVIPALLEQAAGDSADAASRPSGTRRGIEG
ncbi:NAD(P)H-hydrate dehydratase [Telluria mixta]|uniref:ADP-dependent (S)-NAD(P)H-hydrate dehydratase n=1 Tax=Telluria mixta TaxID=34071 RepID=A0ABT2C8P8_9BURK|nr:NAD(P)H-hydrate dehydratase [Telluria mixta]MCS0633049.1 NAD(P)H-hydrate dehydratase [Telluria mixta]WEM96133.1 NAD(P)H-hydrate dehydratase [Telluria mixta]